jgi:hypothetical protein
VEVSLLDPDPIGALAGDRVFVDELERGIVFITLAVSGGNPECLFQYAELLVQIAISRLTERKVDSVP